MEHTKLSSHPLFILTIGTVASLYIGIAGIALVRSLGDQNFFGELQINEGFLFLSIFIGVGTALFLFFLSLIRNRSRATESLKKNIEQLEEALRKIHSSDQTKNEFLAILAHELRNPLSPVLSALEIIKVQGLAAPGSGQLIDVVERQIHTVAELLDDLLDISRISKKKFKLEKETFDLRTTVTRSVQAVQYILDAKGHSFSLPSAQPAVA